MNRLLKFLARETHLKLSRNQLSLFRSTSVMFELLEEKVWKLSMFILIYLQHETFGQVIVISAYSLMCLYNLLCLAWIFLFKVPRKTWVLQWPGQVVICVSSIFWTEEVSEAIRKGTLPVRFSSTFIFLSTKIWLINKKCLLGKKILTHTILQFTHIVCLIFCFIFSCVLAGACSHLLWCVLEVPLKEIVLLYLQIDRLLLNTMYLYF